MKNRCSTVNCCKSVYSLGENVLLEHVPYINHCAFSVMCKRRVSVCELLPLNFSESIYSLGENILLEYVPYINHCAFSVICKRRVSVCELLPLDFSEVQEMELEIPIFDKSSE